MQLFVTLLDKQENLNTLNNFSKYTYSGKTCHFFNPNYDLQPSMTNKTDLNIFKKKLILIF